MVLPSTTRTICFLAVVLSLRVTMAATKPFKHASTALATDTADLSPSCHHLSWLTPLLSRLRGGDNKLKSNVVSWWPEQENDPAHDEYDDFYASHSRRSIQDAVTQFQIASKVAIVHMLFYALRPDPWVQWTWRLPRIIWELILAGLLHMASRISSATTRTQPITISHTTTVTSLSPSLCLLLACMTASTALTDLLIWAPLYAFWTDFSTCTGGDWWTGQKPTCRPDYVKGWSRLGVTVAAAVGGLVYLWTAVVAWTAATTLADHRQVGREWHLFRRRRQQQQELARQELLLQQQHLQQQIPP